ncbi:MAG: cytochrome d ubiquinol oxidase subunit II [Duncaniella sp.]|nr:cytochrome d ubiquinol oxidase subunit II [Duncaniella sp.]HBI59408.1 cytochrome C oxidase assembly protein [Porphyromonadaceae bacterium]
MIALETLQIYWWLLISVLGALLVFMLFVQGGQTMLLSVPGTSDESGKMISSLGHKWELTFTTLVVFGGAFFASFPLFYSTSFGGAYWLWMLILISFVLQAVSYEFRRKPGNLFGTRTYDTFLFLNGCLGCILLGVAVGMFFFGAEFSVSKGNILDAGAPVISVWAPTHGLEAIFYWKNLVLGLAVLFLARTLAALYFLNNHPDDDAFFARNKRRVLVNGVIFVVFFLLFLALLLTTAGLQTVKNGELTGRSTFELVEFKYFHNYIDMWWCAAILLVGVVMVLWGTGKSAFGRHYTCGIWWAGTGTVLVVLTIFWVAGYNSTPYYPSLTDPSSSLTIFNSSSSHFTLTAMSYVSLIIPFVLAYIAYAWHSMDRKH